MATAIATSSSASTVRLEELMPSVYQELRRVAAAELSSGRGRGNVTLQPTSLVHEVYLRMWRRGLRFDDRRHFFFVSTRAMRDILLERARLKGRRARLARDARPSGGSVVSIELPSDVDRTLDLLALDEALRKLERYDDSLAEVVMLRFYGGLAVEEVAEVVGRSLSTVKREWAFARTWLRREMGEDPAASVGAGQ